jgi:integrase
MASPLNEAAIKALPIPEKGNKVHYFTGAVLQGQRAPRGFGVRVTAGGATAFILTYRVGGKQYRYTIGQYPEWSALQAVREARGLRQRVDRGENPLDDRRRSFEANTVGTVLDNFMARYARNKDRPLRSADEYQRTFDRLVRPAIGKIPIDEVRRSDIVAMLDRIEDKSGPVMADRTLAYLRKALNWYAARDDHFLPPIIKGMARTKPSERARARVLSDTEIQLIWPLLDGTFGAFVKTLLLTAQRRSEVASMHRREIDGEAVWAITAEAYKTKRTVFVPLSSAARGLIEAQPTEDYVFLGRTRKTPFSGFGKAKAALDDAITRANGGQPLLRWTLHDLRRTAKTLMVRAGVRPDISERVLGHVIPGVEGIYDRHDYLEEKRHAVERLAEMIARIVNSPAGDRVPSTEDRAGCF